MQLLNVIFGGSLYGVLSELSTFFSVPCQKGMWSTSKRCSFVPGRQNGLSMRVKALVRTLEQAFCSGMVLHVPARQVPRLLRILKHPIHRRHARNVPSPKFTSELETRKHLFHINDVEYIFRGGDVGCSPTGNIPHER